MKKPIEKTMEALILIVEDEAPQAEMLRYNLESEGFRTALASDGEEGLALAESLIPDLAILDWMLPGMSGIDLCRRLRASDATRHIPIILLTARGEENDKVQGLDSGADDFVIKPFSPREVMARVRALLRRTRPALSDEKLSFADINMDLAAHKVTRGDKSIHLGPTEFRLLRALMERPGRVLTRERLLDLAWGREIYVDDRTVDVHIRRLRKVLNTGAQIDLIRTVRGAGYSLDES